MNILILGATGYLGSNVMRTLSQTQNNILTIPHSENIEWLEDFFLNTLWIGL